MILIRLVGWLTVAFESFRLSNQAFQSMIMQSIRKSSSEQPQLRLGYFCVQGSNSRDNVEHVSSQHERKQVQLKKNFEKFQFQSIEIPPVHCHLTFLSGDSDILNF